MATAAVSITRPKQQRSLVIFLTWAEHPARSPDLTSQARNRSLAKPPITDPTAAETRARRHRPQHLEYRRRQRHGGLRSRPTPRFLAQQGSNAGSASGRSRIRVPAARAEGAAASPASAPAPATWNIVGRRGGGTPLAPEAPGFWLNKDAAADAASGRLAPSSGSALNDISAVQGPGGGPGTGTLRRRFRQLAQAPGSGEVPARSRQWSVARPWQRSRQRQWFRSRGRRQLQPARMEFGRRRQRMGRGRQAQPLGQCHRRHSRQPFGARRRRFDGRRNRPDDAARRRTEGHHADARADRAHQRRFRPETRFAAFPSRLSTLPRRARFTVSQALSALAAQAPSDSSDKPTLLKLAEHIAIRFAMESYERGDIEVNAVRQVLDEMSQELDSLRKIMGVYEEKMARHGIEVQSHTDMLAQQFWAQVPDEKRKAVLESAEAWCVPPAQIREYVEGSVAQGKKPKPKKF